MTSQVNGCLHCKDWLDFKFIPLDYRPSRAVYIISRIVKRYGLFPFEDIINIMDTKENAIKFVQTHCYASPFIIRELEVYSQ